MLGGRGQGSLVLAGCREPQQATRNVGAPQRARRHALQGLSRHARPPHFCGPVWLPPPPHHHHHRSRAASLQASQPMRSPGPPAALLMPQRDMPRCRESAAAGRRSAPGSSSSQRYISSLCNTAGFGGAAWLVQRWLGKEAHGLSQDRSPSHRQLSSLRAVAAAASASVGWPLFSPHFKHKQSGMRRPASPPSLA